MLCPFWKCWFQEKKNINRTEHCDFKLSFFLIPFPTNNSELQEEWIWRVNHKNWKVNYDTRICSVHFENVGFKKRKTLHEYPYPTKYIGYELKGERAKQKRKPPVARLTLHQLNVNIQGKFCKQMAQKEYYLVLSAKSVTHTNKKLRGFKMKYTTGSQSTLKKRRMIWITILLLRNCVTDQMYALYLDCNASSGNSCPICHTLCKDEEELSVFNKRSVGCDICYAWFHFGYLKMTPKKLEEIGESSWYCSLCSEENV